MTASSDGSKGRDDALRALRDIGLSPDSTKLLAAIAGEVSDSMLKEMATADYGQSPERHLEGLVGIRDRRLIPDPLEWHPREVLELIRWSQPEDPAWSPGSTGRRGHVMRAFSCTALLISGGLPRGRRDVMGDNQTLAQLIESVIELGLQFGPPTVELVLWRLTEGERDPEEDAFFAFGAAILLAHGAPPGLNARAWTDLSSWVVEAEWLARQVSFRNEGGPWLLGVTNYNLRHALWKSLAQRFLAERSIPGTELLLEGIREWTSDAVETTRSPSMIR